MKLLASGVFALATLMASSALAQAQAPVNYGPAIPGVCVYYGAQTLAQSTVGQSVSTRMNALSQEVAGELAPYAQSIETEITALQQGQASIPPAELQSRSQAVELRIREAQQLEQTRQNELRYTLDVQRRAIATAVDPIIVAVYQERGCGLLLDRESVYLMNPAMDITPTVIERLNVALPSLSFNRLQVPVDQQQAQ